MRFFTVVDALKGYHQCALDEESMALTTFSTPEGLHQYTRLPMGISHNGRRFHDIFCHIPITARCMEDIIIFSRTYEEHIRLLRLLFRTADEHNVSFNKKKTIFASHTGVFAGYVVSEHGFCPNPALTQAILEFPQPSNVIFGHFLGSAKKPGISARR